MIDLVDYVAEEERLCVRIHVNIAELCDAHAFEGLRQALQMDIDASDLDPVTLNPSCIEREGRNANYACLEQAPSGDRVRGAKVANSYILSY